nr:DUF6801 domain-containing protein [Nocardioides stalactiti]
MSRRSSAFALTVLLSAVLSLLAGPTPAHATEVDKTIGYRCSSSFGSGNSGVRIEVTIPDQVRRGVQVPGRQITFKIKVPADMVDVMRQYNIDTVSAQGRASYTVGDIRRPIRTSACRRRTCLPAAG